MIYRNGTMEVWYGDVPPMNINVLWQKRIVSNGIETSELLQFDNNTQN